MRRHSSSSSAGKQSNDLENKDVNHSIQSPKKSKRTAIEEYLIDYTKNANLHGLKYIGGREQTLVEKLFWLSIFVCCVVFCFYLISTMWKKWNESPVIVSLTENTTPVWQIPFPAVTLCVETKAMQTKFNFTENFHIFTNTVTRHNMSEEHRQIYEDLCLVCDDYLASNDGRKTSNGTETVDNIISVSPNLTDVFFGCKWQDIPKEECAHLFSPILTEEGLCYTFNMLPAENIFRVENLHKDYSYLEVSSQARNNIVNITWNLDSNYPANTPMESYPHRGTGYGAQSGLIFLISSKLSDLDYLCRGPAQGFKILLHNPAEMPRISQQYFRSPLSQEVVVAVKPNMVTTSDGLKPYLPERRQCYFSSERYLRYFKIYTQSNCEMECLANFTDAKCGCVHFGLPHGADMNVCNAGSVACMKLAQMELVIADKKSGLYMDVEVNNTLHEVASKCQCLPACNTIEYEVETSQADFNWKAIYRAYRVTLPEDQEDMLYTRVLVFFKKPLFRTSWRSGLPDLSLLPGLYGQTDFLANCGGLLSVFVGFSVLSFAEVVYFFMLRLLSYIWRHRNKNRQLEYVDKEQKVPGNSMDVHPTEMP